ncbi:SoxR reducing system RseC family protein [Butyricicoccus sp. Marseille-Q5471]|uniref:SoxR reducing system RseC family protein n=1 Tax=Butyricicoccus sp. Marseille-Q5471 TaxID=3039493 RepID=UPI0024BC9AA4|nr:SoxR reducing system RseC family protein [Butyricicoccus sp. Marseille-Q5471]
MTQQATVKRLLTHNMAEVEVTRRSACGHDCKKCGGCGGMETQLITVTARNTAGAQPGDQVSIEGETRQVLGLAALVYALPIVLFFIGYALGASMRLGEGTAALIGGVLFVAGILLAIAYSRHMKHQNKVTFTITGLI